MMSMRLNRAKQATRSPNKTKDAGPERWKEDTAWVWIATDIGAIRSPVRDGIRPSKSVVSEYSWRETMLPIIHQAEVPCCLLATSASTCRD
jgi:hypothetical protein